MMAASSDSPRQGKLIPAGQAHVEPLYPPARLLKSSVLRAEKLLAEAKAERKKAREEREQILAEARAEVESYRQEGMRRGLEEGAKEFITTLNNLEATLDTLRARFPEEVKHHAFQFARAILDVEFAVKPERIVDLVSKVLEQAKHQDNVVVHLNPANVEIVREAAEKNQDKLVFQNALEFRADPDLPRNGVRVETQGGGLFHGSVESQLQRLADLLNPDSDSEQES